MKNNLLTTAFLLSCAVGLAQLTIKPTIIGGDSYVYVKNQVLYVEKEINLTQNPGADFKASIYLREGGQLMQGGSTSANTGNGQLSVRQTDSQSNNWAYRYWASPVGNPIDAGNQNFGVGLLYDHMNDANLTKATITATTAAKEGARGTNINPMTISTRWLYTHMMPGTEAEGNYTRMNANYSAPAGYGFTMKGVGDDLPGNSQIYEFRGRPNNGEFLIPVGYVDEPLMTLSGNPYPSALDLNKLYYDFENTRLGSFWYYDEDRSIGSHYYTTKPYGYGTYTVGLKDPNFNPTQYLGIYTAAPFYIWNAAGNSTSHGGTGQNIQGRRFAPIGQGIMFVGHLQAGASSPIKIKNSHRVFITENLQSSIFHRTLGDETYEESYNSNSLNTTSNVDRQKSHMRLYVVFDDAVTRDMVLSFSNQATDAYDRGLDGHSPMGLKTDAYFPIGTRENFSPYVIQAVKFHNTKNIPINFTLDKQTKIDVRLIEEINKPYQKVYLYDKQKNISIELSRKTNASSAFYLPAGEHNSRFFIVFHDPTPRLDMSETQGLAREDILKNITFFQNNPARQMEISNLNEYNITSAALYDMNSKMMVKIPMPGKDSSFSFYTGSLSNGVYLVKLIIKENFNIEYKAIVNNK